MLHMFIRILVLKCSFIYNVVVSIKYSFDSCELMYKRLVTS